MTINKKSTCSPGNNALQITLGVVFRNAALLDMALTHSSYANENPDIAPSSNERLEFLGDAVLGLVVASKLYEEFPYLSEGQMTKLRAILVRRDMLAKVARTIKLGSYLYMGKGEESSGGRSKPANLARAIEAVLGAVFLDQGLEVAEKVTMRLLYAELRTAVDRGTGTDHKSQLQEFVQAKMQKIPTYHVIDVSGPDHDRRFTIEVKIGNEVYGTGSGKSKKIAETEAAAYTLNKLRENFT